MRERMEICVELKCGRKPNRRETKGTSISSIRAKLKLSQGCFGKYLCAWR